MTQCPIFGPRPFKFDPRGLRDLIQGNHVSAWTLCKGGNDSTFSHSFLHFVTLLSATCHGYKQNIQRLLVTLKAVPGHAKGCVKMSVGKQAAEQASKVFILVFEPSPLTCSKDFILFFSQHTFEQIRSQGIFFLPLRKVPAPHPKLLTHCWQGRGCRTEETTRWICNDHISVNMKHSETFIGMQI